MQGSTLLPAERRRLAMVMALGSLLFSGTSHGVTIEEVVPQALHANPLSQRAQQCAGCRP